MITVGIAGATGYAGQELIELLLRHHGVRISCLCSSTETGKTISELLPRFKGRIELPCEKISVDTLVKKCDTVFLALPHTVSTEYVPALLSSGKRVIDLSADYRFRDPKVYEEHYKKRHSDSTNLKSAIYGLPEIYRQKIKSAQLVANPGCYPTAAILALAPILSVGDCTLDSLIIDAKSGTSGAGKKLAHEYLFNEINEDFLAYKVNCHQHAPEINQELSRLFGKRLRTVFVPHLLPVYRGILETIYIKTGKKSFHTDKLVALYRKFYKTENYVRIKDPGLFPRLKDVVGTNFCDIGIRADGDTVIIISAIDNLLKGAAGQAVQNFNIMYQFPERTAIG